MPAIIVPAVVAVGMIILGGMVSSSCKPLFNLMSQQLFKLFPNELIPPFNLISLRYKGLIDENTYFTECELNGMSNERATLLYDEAAQRLGAYDAINLWRRGGIDEPERNRRVMVQGWKEEQIPDLLTLTKQLPNANDVIAFAVREVYSPDIAEAFGQYEGGDKVYDVAEADILATGMDKETFVKYWAAHWKLPSITQGYEMLHRKIIDDSALDKLFEALDIMPWWRDKLKAMSYSPFTRVDVRRMHKLGILSDEQLLTAYQDLGYDEEKSQSLAGFTILYNATPESAQMTEEDIEMQRYKEATREAVMKAYRNHQISSQETKTYLQDLGYSGGAIELYMINEDYALEEDITNEKIQTVHEAYVRHIFSRNMVLDQLGKLNLPSAYVSSLIDRWDIEREAKTARPSKAELFKLHSNRIIDEVTLRAELYAQGYKQEYVDWYIELISKTGGG